MYNLLWLTLSRSTLSLLDSQVPQFWWLGVIALLVASALLLLSAVVWLSRYDDSEAGICTGLTLFGLWVFLSPSIPLATLLTLALAIGGLSILVVVSVPFHPVVCCIRKKVWHGRE